MEAVPLSKKIHDKAKSLGVTSITLGFQGGNDEGCLDVSCMIDGNELTREQKKKLSEFESEVENWAWSVYAYSGAGDGNDYGDDITYDLENNKVVTKEWFMERTDKPEEEGVLVLSDGPVDEDEEDDDDDDDDDDEVDWDDEDEDE